ncbi:MAG: ASCH domain-containing protein [Rhodospirillales bacterium]|nr:ASCH domain-containing protein [Rhodospirillales bacterium]
MEKTPSTNEYWEAFTTAIGKVGAAYTAVAFGDTAAMADELAALVISGKKRATVSLLRDYATGVEAVPQAGDFGGGGRRRPKCIWRTTEVAVKPLSDVDDAFAWDEAKGTERAIGGYRPTGRSFRPRRDVRDSRCATRSKPCSSGLKSSGRRILPISPIDGASKRGGMANSPRQISAFGLTCAHRVRFGNTGSFETLAAAGSAISV